MSSNQTDEEIIDLYKDGDNGVFKLLIDRYTKVLYNFTVHFVNPDNATDIIQETFIKAWKNIKYFDEEKASFKTWLFAIAKNTTTDFLRKKKIVLFSDIQNENEIDFSETIQDENLLPDEVLQKLQDTSLLNKLLDRLRDDYKTVLILHYQEEMTFNEIGKILNKPPNTVKSYHQRAIKELQKMLS